MGVPADTDEITREWLTTALHQAGALDQATVTSIQPSPVGHVGFTGQIRRLQISYDKPEPCAPRSLVAKFSATHPKVRAVVHSIGFYEREIGFYRELAADCPVRTPRCYFGEVQMDSGASLLLLEDLSWMQDLGSAGGSVHEAELVIRELGKLHAAWWGDARLDRIPWLAMKGILTPDQTPLVFTQNWESFLSKLSIPVTEELLWAGELCARYLYAVSVWMLTEPPRTLIHNDVHGDNLLVAGDGEQSLAILDWQLTTPARPGLDLAGFLVGYLDTSERRREENRLLEMYCSVLTQHGITGYSFEQCWDDYRMALVLPTSHLAIAVGDHPGLTATPDGDWNILFPRYAKALADLGVAELLRQRYG
jgi:Phosphotransferase enzyme family